jgi:Holliday junction resolvasome RuvABC endonuclease subunit
VDPGFRYPGFAELDAKTGRLIRWGITEAALSTTINMSIRAWKIGHEIMTQIAEKMPRGKVVVGIEAPAYRMGAKFASYEQMARARQATFDHLLFALDDVVIYEPTPQQVKRAATGNPHAKKEQVIDYVIREHRVNLPAAKAKREAACDAIAVAHATRNIWKRQVLEGMAK